MSSMNLTRHVLDRIGDIDRRLNSYATVTAEQALAAARFADEEIRAGRYRGPLQGVPIAVKDVCCTKGVRTMGGTAVRKDFVPDINATVVSRLHEAGAVLMGKLNLTEGAMAGYHPDFDVPLNPWDASRWPGLSSSGAGVATAAGLCFGAIGTDTGGSIRFPASANGVVGLKPTYGLVSRFGVLPLADSLDHVGLIARRVADAAIMLDAVAGFDPNDPTSLPGPTPNITSQLARGIDGMSIGLDRAYALTAIDGGAASSLEEALNVLTRLGARVVDVEMPDLSDVLYVWFTLCSAEAAAAHRATYPSRAAEYGPYFREVLQIGSSVSEGELASARTMRAEIATRFAAVLESVDAIVCPGAGAPAWPISRAIHLGTMAVYHTAWDAASPKSGVFTMPMNLAGTPAICVPSGFSAEGLPYSIQFAGRNHSEATLCRIAFAYERAMSGSPRHPEF
jgi:amidase